MAEAQARSFKMNLEVRRKAFSLAYWILMILIFIKQKTQLLLDEEKAQTEVLRSQTNRQNQEIQQLKQVQRESDVQIQSLQTTVTVCIVYILE